MSSPPAPIDAVVALGRALDALIVALASGSAANLFATEAGLAAAIGDVARIGAVAPGDRDRVRAELARARAAVHRCRAVGAAVTGVIDGWLTVGGLSHTYDRSGAVALERLARPATHARL